MQVITHVCLKGLIPQMTSRKRLDVYFDSLMCMIVTAIDCEWMYMHKWCNMNLNDYPAHIAGNFGKHELATVGKWFSIGSYG